MKINTSYLTILYSLGGETRSRGPALLSGIPSVMQYMTCYLGYLLKDLPVTIISNKKEGASL